MFCVGDQSGNVPPPHQTCDVVAAMHDQTWNVEWGKLRPLYSGMGSWQPIQHFGGSCREVQEQIVSKFYDDEELDSSEDDYEPGQIVCGEVVASELPSVGSKDHAIGECKRCAFFFKGRCRNGKECSHCHLPHEEPRRKRNRRKMKASAGPVEDNDEYEGDLDDDTATEPPVFKAHRALAGTPVHLPAGADCQGFDNMLVFGSVTPEMQPLQNSKVVQPQMHCAAASFPQKVNEEHSDHDDEAGTATTVAFASLWNSAKKPAQAGASTEEMEAEAAQQEEASLLAEMEAEAVRLEEEALVAEKEARRLVEEAAAAEVCTRKRASPVASFHVYYQDNILPACSDVYWTSLYASFSQAASTSIVERAEEVAPAKQKQSLQAEEGETTASSEENNSDASGTGHDFSSNCSDKADQTSSDSDVPSPLGGKRTATLSENLSSQSHERKPRQTHKQVSDAVRSSKRSPLWPNCVPTAGPSDSPNTKAVLPPEGEPKKEASCAAQVSKKTSWAARPRAAENPEFAVVRKARGILNKLTESNLETMYNQLVECGIRSITQLEALIMEIFEKATAQHGFLPMYVEICVRLNSHFEKDPIEGADFRKVLVGACQRTFEKTLRFQPEVDKNLSYEDQYEIELKFKTRMLGNIRFIGELLVHKLLAGKVLLAVSEELLSVGDSASIEAVVTLLTVAGPAFDRKSWVFVSRLQAIFSMLRCMSKDQAIAMRARCIIKDLLELRDAGWKKQKQ